MTHMQIADRRQIVDAQASGVLALNTYELTIEFSFISVLNLGFNGKDAKFQEWLGRKFLLFEFFLSNHNKEHSLTQETFGQVKSKLTYIKSLKEQKKIVIRNHQSFFWSVAAKNWKWTKSFNILKLNETSTLYLSNFLKRLKRYLDCLWTSQKEIGTTWM